MKKRKKNAGALSAALLAASVFLPGCNRTPAVYGPPPEAEETEPEDVKNQEEQKDPEPEFDPSENIQEDVYGPPPFEDND